MKAGPGATVLDRTSAQERTADGTVGQTGDVFGLFIERLEHLAPLTAPERSALARLDGRVRAYKPRTDLVHEGAPCDDSVIVLGGIVCCYKLRASGARQIFAFHLPGDLCAAEPVFDRLDHGISTLAASHIARVPHAALRALADAHPGIRVALHRTALLQRAIASAWLMDVGSRSASERIAHLICELHVRQETVGLADGDGFGLPITQADLADTLGLTDVHVNRTLRELRREGLMEFQGRRVRILNRQRLAALAEFRADYLRASP